MSGPNSAGPNPAAPAGGPREWAVFFGWIAGLVLIGGAAWFFTQPVREKMLMNSVNRILAQEKGARLLSAPLAAPRSSGLAVPLGSWYGLENSGDVFFVFALMRDGPLALWGARVSPGGKVEELLPLSGHARQIFADLPQGMLLTYIHRIEALGFPAKGGTGE
jgi:hypothetical protein